MMMLIAGHKQKQWETAPAVLFVLLFALAGSAAVTPQYNPAAGHTDQEMIVNNVWVDMPLTQAFRDISMETGVVIALCPHVPDPLISLDAGMGKPLDECLCELIAGRGLFVHRKTNRFYLISDASPACPAFLETAIPQRLYLKYITAAHLTSSLPKAIRQYVSSGERNNEVLIYAIPEITKHIRTVIDKLDIPRPQVVLEVLVVDLWEDASEEFGLDWEVSSPHTSFSMEEGVTSFTGIASYTSLSAADFLQLRFTLRSLVSQGKASVRSRPRVATLNGEKAAIDISLDEYFTIATDYYGSVLRTDLQIVKSGVVLEMTPHIGDDGDITVSVHTVVSDVVSRQNANDNSGGDLPVIRRREARTNVRVKQGDAIVIGGLVETQEQDEDKSVPLLSSIPIIGGLFKSKSSSTMKKEVIIFITPRLVKQGQVAFADRHDLLAADQELAALQQPAPSLNAQHRPHRDSVSLAEDIESLRKVVSLLDDQPQSSQQSLDTDDEAQNPFSEYYYNLLAEEDEVENLRPPQTPPDVDDKAEIPFTDRGELLNVAEEIEALRQVIALLDTQYNPSGNCLGTGKKREPLYKESP